MPTLLLADLIYSAIDFLDCELDIVKFELKHPTWRTSASVPAPAMWGGPTANLLELHLAPQAVGLLRHPSGMPMTYDESVDFLEKTYGVSVSNPSDRRAKILERYDNTAFMDTMRKVYLLEAEVHNTKAPRK